MITCWPPRIRIGHRHPAGRMSNSRSRAGAWPERACRRRASTFEPPGDARAWQRCRAGRPCAAAPPSSSRAWSSCSSKKRGDNGETVDSSTRAASYSPHDVSSSSSGVRSAERNAVTQPDSNRWLPRARSPRCPAHVLRSRTRSHRWPAAPSRRRSPSNQHGRARVAGAIEQAAPCSPRTSGASFQPSRSDRARRQQRDP